MTPAKRPTILLVDDEREHLTLQALILKEAGYRPVTVVVGSELLSLPDHEAPSLIFLDYRLNSFLNCAQVAQLLRQTFRRTPIVLLSSMVEMPPEMTPFVDSFLKKGNPEDMVAVARKMIDGNGQGQQ